MSEPALSPAPWVARLRAALPAALESSDPDAVHTLRSATRRIDTWLRLAGRERLRDDLRWLRRAAGPVRDLDVLIARDWPAREARRLRSLRAVARKALKEALEEPRVEAVTLALSVLPPVRADQAWGNLAILARDVRGLPPAEDDLQSLHRLRRAVRRLRYGLDWLDVPADALAPVQDAFGEVNDLAVAVRYLGPDAVPAAALAERVRAALDAWQAARPTLATWC